MWRSDDSDLQNATLAPLDGLGGALENFVNTTRRMTFEKGSVADSTEVKGASFVHYSEHHTGR